MRTIFHWRCPVAGVTRELAGERPFFCCEPMGPCYKPPPAASRPDMMLSAGVAELVDALDLGSSDESCGGSSPSARTKRFQRLHDELLENLS
jgi:hypothetical protein